MGIIEKTIHLHRPAPHDLDTCRRCELWRHATHGVPGEGALTARIIVIGEQPGDQEDRSGHPFVGPAGRILDGAFDAAGLARDEVYVTNAVKHFKWELRGKRRLHKTPAQQEIEACHYWLQTELDEPHIKVIVTLGAVALKSVLGVRAIALKRILNDTLEHGRQKLVPTYHPSYVLRLRDPEEKDKATQTIIDALKLARQLTQG